MQIEDRLKELGIELPPAITPVANYIPAVVTGNLVFLSGHGPVNEDGTLVTGKVGADLTIEEGYETARLIAMGLLGSLKAQIGSLDRVKRIVKLLGLVLCLEVGDYPPTVWSHDSIKQVHPAIKIGGILHRDLRQRREVAGAPKCTVS